MRVMGTQAGERGEQDGRHRGAERQMQHLAGRKALPGENDGQHRHNDHAAAHPEQAGEKTGARAGQQVSRDDIEGNHAGL
jgi:hypothetical protein